MTDDPKASSNKAENAENADDMTVSYLDAPAKDLPGPQGVPAAELPPNVVFAPGQTLAGRFRVIRFVARGGMGEVYEAEDQELNERVAVKTARFESSQGSHEIERFRREIQLARKVTHPNVCRTFDVFRHVTPTPDSGAASEILLVSMELLAGKTLHNRVHTGGPLTTAEAMPIVTQLCAGLQAAHSVGVIHRDFKSSNVMLAPAFPSGQHGTPQQTPRSSQSFRAVITDFGLAHAEEHHGQTLTRPGDMVGTPAYMAPEQIEGGLITPATDIYSLGIVIYEMLTGELPFVGDTPLSTAMKRLKAPAPSPLSRVPDLDAKWVAVVARCLEREPQQRFANTEEIIQGLRGQSIALPPAVGSATGSGPGGPDSLSSIPAIATSGFVARRLWPLTIALIVFLFAGGTWLAIRYRETRNAAQRMAAQPAESGARKAVAILGFKNLSDRKDADSLGNVLADGLWSQLDTGQLRFIAPGQVDEMKENLSLGEISTSVTGKQAEAIHKYLGADVLVTGSYTVSGPPGNASVLWNIRLLSAEDGQNLGSFAPSGKQSDLNDLVVHAGSLVRQKFGISLTPAEEARMDSSLSTNTEAVTAFSEARQKLRTFDLLGATKLLEKSVEADPKFAQAHSALAEAWDALGFETKATEEAKKALDADSRLSTEARNVVSARYFATTRDWQRAVQQYAQLWTQYRDEPEYGLLLANTQIRAGKAKDALTTVGQVRSQSPPAGIRAQLDLAEARAHETLGDYKEELTAATSAAETAQFLGANLLLARARILQCFAQANLGEAAKAIPLCNEAKQINLSAGDQLGVARATNDIAYAQYSTGNYSEAEPLYQEALGIAQSIGDKYDEAGALNNLGNIQSSRGANAEARKTYERSIGVAQERGEMGDAARARQNLALVLYASGDVARGKQMFVEALKTARDIGDRNLEATLLNNQCGVELGYGALLQAHTSCEESLRIRREINDRADIGKTLSSYGAVQLQRGDVDTAAATLQEALADLESVGAKNDAAWARVALVPVFLESGKIDEAKKQANDAVTELAAEKDVSGEAEARIALASALLAANDLAGAREQVEKASWLAAQAGDRGVDFDAKTAAARVDARSGKTEVAIKALTSVRKDARAAGMVQAEFEARLALGEAQIASGKKTDGTATLRILADEAKARGYGLLAGKASVAGRA
ncbi:MAG: protein kinase [Candidatus Acidiferrum sp.]